MVCEGIEVVVVVVLIKVAILVDESFIVEGITIFLFIIIDMIVIIRSSRRDKWSNFILRRK